ncbi:hypothetical protein [Pseudarthrobacter sp. BIM B-2242]|uniref:hypothetical protein n=1 Tax=Pseudarthrobacter sp. BIM B-2242 TaxID=2772401 RepID=UPI00168C0840|nr:hypothetical protein [Pseudarthrobacter sp. BIM B-2242]QOD05710.1 hypothetical protein IDT60_21955 [Pseudarthrobacter sp. BIM B-2242]
MSTSTQPRQPQGIPTGGEYAAFAHGEPGFQLKFAKDRQSMAERRELLRSAGFIPATTLQASAHPSTTEHREDWWDRNLVAAEYRSTGTKTYPQMPDDYTPAKTFGQAMSGLRRTHRMKYENGDISVRMPSATAVKRYSAENGNPTFDVPVSVSIKGAAPVQGWVRVTKTGPSSWEATAQGGSGANADMLSEAVAATLESRRPSIALKRIPDLLEAHRQREEAKGDPLEPIRSSFIDAIGYDESTGTMATKIGEKVYGHRVSKDFFELVKNAERPGSIFNKFIKGNPGAGVQKCPRCARFFTPDKAHTCPTAHKEESGLNQDYTERARKRAERVAASRSHGVDPALAKNAVQPPAPINTAPGAGAQPVPTKKTGLPGRQAAVAFSGLGATPATPRHLATPIRDRASFYQELQSLKASGRAQGFDVLSNGVESRAEASCSTAAYNAHVAVKTDGTLQRFLNGQPVPEYTAEQRKAQEMEAWAARNALGMARITDAEEFLRSRRAAAAAAAPTK